jgi:hypothetical protein
MFFLLYNHPIWTDGRLIKTFKVSKKKFDEAGQVNLTMNHRHAVPAARQDSTIDIYHLLNWAKRCWHVAPQGTTHAWQST